jgi:RecB family exonuclease
MLEIDPALVNSVDTAAFESHVVPEHVFTLKPADVDSMSDHTYLTDAFLEQGLSATALNNYLDCPWKYFYRNLVRVPEKPTPSSLYGNALHNALRLFRDLSSSTQKYQPLSKLLEYLEVSIDAQGFTPTSYADAHKKGVRALTDWYERNTEVYQFRALCEKKFEVYMPLLEHTPERILLRGLIDVIEFHGDNSLRVIDYKTGKHLSRNDIEGKTKNATGDYKRQLDFYCILMELSLMERPSTLSLEFIEPDARGKTDVHAFSYDELAVKELKATIERVSSEIYSLAFWEKKCETTDCEYCALRDLTRK